MFYFWVIVLALGIGSRILALIHGKKHKYWRQISRTLHEPEYSGRVEVSAMISVLWKRYIAVPAAFNGHCSQATGWGTIPPRIQSLTCALSTTALRKAISIGHKNTHNYGATCPTERVSSRSPTSLLSGYLERETIFSFGRPAGALARITVSIDGLPEFAQYRPLCIQLGIPLWSMNVGHPANWNYGSTNFA
jgi:hypothetical protein